MNHESSCTANNMCLTSELLLIIRFFSDHSILGMLFYFINDFIIIVSCLTLTLAPVSLSEQQSTLLEIRILPTADLFWEILASHQAFSSINVCEQELGLYHYYFHCRNWRYIVIIFTA